MPITFDTMDELIEFCNTFQLSESNGKLRKRKTSGKTSDLKKQKSVKRSRSNSKLVKSKAKKRQGPTLTARIQDAITQFVAKRQSFTANDIYAVLSKKDKQLNKQSVITSVLKQMNTNFNTVKVTNAKGNGPRPVKLYQPA